MSTSSAALTLEARQLATRAGQECKALRTLLNGNQSTLSGLTTTAKASLVAAINELADEINTLQSATVAWADITGKPSTFTPSAHTHDDRYYTEAETNSLLSAKADTSSLGTAAAQDADQDLETTDDVEFNSVTCGPAYYTSGAISTITGTTYTLSNSDRGKALVFTNASAITVTVPPGLTALFGCALIQKGAGTIALDDDSGATTLESTRDPIETSGEHDWLNLFNLGTTDTYTIG